MIALHLPQRERCSGWIHAQPVSVPHWNQVFAQLAVCSTHATQCPATAGALCSFVSIKYKSLAELPAGAVIGSAALRRQAQVLARHPHLKVVNFRGNVQSRIRKLQEEQARCLS